MAALRSAVDAANKAMQQAAPGIEFSLDKESGRAVVRVVDRQTREVLRQIPDEDMLRMSQAMDKMQGLLVRLVA